MLSHNNRYRPVEAFRRKVCEYARTQSLLALDDTIVVAVSGGADSVVLLDVLSELSEEWRLTLHVAHLNHGLRGRDADEDALFVENLARERSLPFHTKKAACRQIAKTLKLSIEETARVERLDFLLSVADSVGAHKIATGHHMDDQAETVLIRLLRGTGTTGLAAIRPIRDGLWIRPLLNEKRVEIDAYICHCGLSWRSDASNLDVSIPRNRIRHQLLPILRSDYSHHATDALARAATILQADDDLLESITLDASKTVVCARSNRKIALVSNRFFGYHIAVQRRLIRVFLTQAGVDPRRVEFRLIDRILALLRHGPGSIQVSSDLTVCTTGRLILFGAAAPAFEKHVEFGENRIPSINARLSVDEVEHPDYPARFAEITPFEIWFDRSVLPRDLVLRTVKPGDRIRLFGSGGSAKVSDILINHKIPRLIRDEIPVLAHQREVFWIVGVRASERSRIPESSRQAVRFRFAGSWLHFFSGLQRCT